MLTFKFDTKRGVWLGQYNVYEIAIEYKKTAQAKLSIKDTTTGKIKFKKVAPHIIEATEYASTFLSTAPLKTVIEEDLDECSA